ncbi:MAG TPA: hypothetical protein PLY34_06770 [Ferruginibacter sp.]|nr:hypothetical protein [Ferruginibacter sp.]HPH91266.1 hypothetical protein [Ferruginibacter sp.]
MEKQTAIKKPAKNLNKPAYIIFLAAGIGFLVTKDLSQAVVFWGLALVFDPFNINQPFQKRPLYQRCWLIVHLAITLALFVLLLMGK